MSVGTDWQRHCIVQVETMMFVIDGRSKLMMQKFLFFYESLIRS